MPKSSKQKRSNAQKLVIVLIFLFFAYTAMLNWGKFIEAYDVIRGVDPKFIFILPAIQLMSYLWIALYYKTTFKLFGTSIKYWNAYRMTAGLYFVEQILPSGGASGIAYLAYGLKSKASPSLTGLVQMGRYGFNHLSYVLITLLGVVWSLPLGNSRVTLLGVGLASLVATSAIAGFYLAFAEDKLNKVINWCARFVNWAGSKIMFKRKEPLVNARKLIKGFDDFHKGIKQIKQDKKQFIAPFLIMSMSAASQIAVVYFSFVALGQTTNLGVLIFAFTFANFVGVLSVVPGDVGVHESAMISALSFMGVDWSVAIAATLIYRVFNKFIMVAIGFFFYSHFLKPDEAAANK